MVAPIPPTPPADTPDDPAHTGRRRILFVDHETRLSGGEQDLLDLVQALLRAESRAFDLHAALPEKGPLWDALEDSGVKVHGFAIDPQLRSASRWMLGKSPAKVATLALGIFKASRSLGRLMDELEPDIVHTNSMKAHLLALTPARFRAIPVIWHIRDILERGWLLRMMRWLGARGPVRIACISQRVAAQFEGSASEALTEVVYNGIDISRFQDVDAASERQRLGAVGGELLVGMVGQIARWKGQDTFIEASIKVAETHPSSRFAVVGECLFPENEGGYDQQIRQAAQALGDRFCFAGWTDDPPAVMNALDVVVHISRLPEPFGRVIVEGMAAGKPVIASASGAGPEIVGEGEGIVVQPDDPEALAQVLSELISNEDLRAKIGSAAGQAAWRFDISKTASSVAQMYRSVWG